VVSSDPDDERLLLSADPEDFGRFYDRHVRAVIGYFSRRTRDPELAADLTAETFAAALVARRRYRIGATPPVAWLFGIAQHKLIDAHRRGGARDRLQKRLGMERVPLQEHDRELIEALGREAAAALVSHLPPEQAAAITAHVLEDHSYEEIAASEQVSAATVRQRVSRGLRALRDRMEVGK
jgi:RNA polymerase sigma factor (sigma-70 family)